MNLPFEKWIEIKNIFIYLYLNKTQIGKNGGYGNRVFYEFKIHPPQYCAGFRIPHSSLKIEIFGFEGVLYVEFLKWI